MFLTSDRIIVARDGYERRPRSGVQSYPHERIGRVRIERGSAGSGRIVVWSAGDVEAASMFFEARARDRADELVALASAQVARARRRAAASGGVATPASAAPARQERRIGRSPASGSLTRLPADPSIRPATSSCRGLEPVTRIWSRRSFRESAVVASLGLAPG